MGFKTTLYLFFTVCLLGGLLYMVQYRKKAVAAERHRSSLVYDFAQDARSQISGRADGMLKILFEKQGHKVIGVHALVEGADDLMGEAALAVKAGIPLEAFAGAIHPHPTLTESFAVATRMTLAGMMGASKSN